MFCYGDDRYCFPQSLVCDYSLGRFMENFQIPPLPKKLAREKP